MNNRLGIPVVVFSTIVGTSIFAAIGKDPGTGWQVLAGLVSSAAAVLAALQTFFKFGEKAVNHKSAGSRYALLRRDIDIFGLRYQGDTNPERDAALSELETPAKRLSQLAKESPHVPDGIYNQAKKEQLESGELLLAVEAKGADDARHPQLVGPDRESSHTDRKPHKSLPPGKGGSK